MARPMTFLQFLARLRVTPTPAQRVLCAVCFDGDQPGDLRGADRDLALLLFGSLEPIPAEARGVVVWRKGARSGGTYLSALFALFASLTVPLDSLAPGERAFAVVVAPDLRLARQALRFVVGALGTRPELRSAIFAQTDSSVTVTRADGRQVTIECLPATRGGSALRGRSLVCAVLSEAAFFRDDSYVINDAELFRAVAPRVVAGGLVVVESTPWTESGLLYELDRDNFGQPSSALVARMPTLLMRPDEATRAVVRRERDRDEDNARREFDAEYLASGSGLFFDPNGIRLSIAPDLTLPRIYDPSCHYGAGADWAFVRDSSALVVVERRGEIFRVAAVEEMRPAPGQPLKPSEVCARFATVMQPFGCAELYSDAHGSEGNREHLGARKISLTFVPGGQAGKVETYQFLREKMNEGKVQLPEHSRLLGQLRAIVSKPTSGGGISITSPRRGGAHGDLVSALVCAVWAATRAGSYQYTPPPPMREYRSPLVGALEGSIREVPGARETGPYAAQLAREADNYMRNSHGFRQ